MWGEVVRVATDPEQLVEAVAARAFEIVFAVLLVTLYTVVFRMQIRAQL